MNPITWIIAALRGTILSPVHTAFLRGLVEAVAFIVLYAVGDYVYTLPDVSPMVLMGLPVLIRFVEGLFDKIDAAKQRQRDALRAEAKYANSDATFSHLKTGDVRN